MGAEVVKIENPQIGDPGRRLRPGQPDNDPYYFHAFNGNKKSITVNLKSPAGQALVKDMIRHADVMSENFAPGPRQTVFLYYGPDVRRHVQRHRRQERSAHQTWDLPRRHRLRDSPLHESGIP